MNEKRWLRLILVLLFACFVSKFAFAMSNRPKGNSAIVPSSNSSQPPPNAREMQLETGEIKPIGGTDSH